MATIVKEDLEVSNRWMRINARNPKEPGTVFIKIPCGMQGHEDHVHTFGMHREDFYRAVLFELGITDPLEDLYARS